MFGSKGLRSVQWVVLSAALLLVPASLPAQSEEALQTQTSLSFVPQDVAFYSTVLRNKEKYEALVESKAYAKLKSQPFMQTALAAIDSQLNDPFGPFADPQNQAALALLGDMFSHEAFVYGDKNFGALMRFIGTMQTANNAAQVRMAVGGDPTAESELPKVMVRTLAANIEDLKVPTLVVGFRVTDAERAKSQLARLEGFVPLMALAAPNITNYYKKTNIGGSDFMTFTVDGSMLPWDQFENDPQIEDVRREFETVKAHVEKMTVAVALGVHKDLVLLTVGPDVEFIGKLGASPLLYDRKELAPLRRHAKDRISSISYVSEEFSASAGGVEAQMDQVVQMAKAALSGTAVDEETRKEMLADLDAATKSFGGMVPEPGAQVGFEYMTKRGFEGYTYNYAENRTLDGSKPLSLLEHVGGNPIGFSMNRTKYAPEDFDTFVKVIERMVYYGEKIALPKASPEEQEAYKQFREVAEPLLERAVATTKEKLLPGFKDGQTAFVVDARIESTQWFAQMPPLPKAVPMLELALVLGVSDAELVRSAMSDYFEITQELLQELHEVDPDEIPLVKLPQPKGEKVGPGTMYKFLLPAQLGIDQQIAPNAALSEQVAVLSLSPQTTERLLQPTPFALRTGPLADRTKPLAGAAYFNWPRLVDAIDSWAQSALDMFGPLLGAAAGVGGGGGDFKSVTDQYDAVVEVLKCYKGYSSATYLEDGAVVTHHESVYEDLKE